MTKHLNVPLNCQLEGMYTLRKYNAETGELVQELGPFNNKITDIGLERFSVGDRCASYAYVGTGTTPAENSNTSMGAFLVSTSTLQTNTSSTNTATAPYWFQRILMYRFAAGAISNNITEVGLGWTNNSVAGLWSRELIVDPSGNPVTLTILPNEYLDVVYTLRLYAPADKTGSFTLNSTVYNYTVRPGILGNWNINITSSGVAPNCAAFTGYNGASLALAPVTEMFSGASATTSQTGIEVTLNPYVINSKTRTAVTKYPAANANIAGGIRGIRMVTQSSPVLSVEFQMLLSAAIPKDSNTAMTLNSSFTWGRYAP